MPDDATDFAEATSFLLSQIGAHVAAQFDERITPAGISPRSFGVMANLAVRGTQTQQQLADALGVHRNAMVGMIDDLETNGWAERRQNPDDRRVHEIHLTPRGLDSVRTAAMEVRALDETIRRAVGSTDHKVLRVTLQRLATSLGLEPGVHPDLARTRASASRRGTIE